MTTPAMPLPFKLIQDVRPWGSFDQYTHNQEVTVKIITVNPGGKLSVQRHKYRDEYWVMLDDGLVPTVGGNDLFLVSGERAYIPRKVVHTIRNESTTPARFLEIAFGHFDEQDIERLEDKYGRV